VQTRVSSLSNRCKFVLGKKFDSMAFTGIKTTISIAEIDEKETAPKILKICDGGRFGGGGRKPPLCGDVK
jgi:hypothetical protein